MGNAGRILALGLLLAAGAARAESSAPAGAGTPIPEAPAQWVTDRAGFLSPAYAATLNDQLADYARRTGHQLLVYIDSTTGVVPIEDWAVRAFERWRVGRKGVDDGLVLFIFSADRRLRIEVGYGLEARVPDALASRIINERMVPRIRAGDRDGAVRDGIKALAAAIGGDGQGAATPDGVAGPARRPSVWTLIGGGIVALLFLWLLITNPALAAMLILNIGSGRRGGGGWGGGGGGGFSGGGGRSGGGGASGSW